MYRKSPWSKMNSDLVHKQRQLKKGLTKLANRIKEIQKDLATYKKCIKQDFEDPEILSYFPLVTLRLMLDEYQAIDKTGNVTCSIELGDLAPTSRFYYAQAQDEWIDLSSGNILEREKTIHGYRCKLLSPDLDFSKEDTTEPRPFYASETPLARYDGGIFQNYLGYYSPKQFAYNLKEIYKQSDEYCFCLPTLSQASAMVPHIRKQHDSFWIVNPLDMNFKGYPIVLFAETILSSLDSESLAFIYNINRQPGINKNVVKAGKEQYKTYPYSPIYPVFNIL